MQNQMSIYKKTYIDYLEQIKGLDYSLPANRMNIEVQDNVLLVPLFGKKYTVSSETITGPGSRKPSFDACVLLCRYLLTCPARVSSDSEWVTFKDFKHSGPLIVYFANDVERAITSAFAGRLPELHRAAAKIGGEPIDIGVIYDMCIKFLALPKIPVVLLFNDADSEFPASCTFLFDHTADKYVDAECLAILGRRLFIDLMDAQQNFSR